MPSPPAVLRSDEKLNKEKRNHVGIQTTEGMLYTIGYAVGNGIAEKPTRDDKETLRVANSRKLLLPLGYRMTEDRGCVTGLPGVRVTWERLQ